MIRPRLLRPGTLAALALALSACSGIPTAISSPSASASVAASATPLRIKPPDSLIKPGTITFLSDTTYPPQESIVNGQAVGFDIDIADALAAKMGLTATIQTADFSTIVQSLLQHKGDAIISAVAITPELQRQVAFVGYFQSGQSILVRKGNPQSITQLQDLCGKRVAVEITTPEQDTLSAANSNECKTTPINMRTFITDTEAIQQLKQGTVDAALDDTPVASYFVKNNPDLLDLGGPPLRTGAEGIAVDPKNTDLLRALQQAMLAIYEEGTYHQLLVKWNLLDDELPASQIVVAPSASP
jgi:polar amino acid transport system substrate-binding protein